MNKNKDYETTAFIITKPLHLPLLDAAVFNNKKITVRKGDVLLDPSRIETWLEGQIEFDPTGRYYVISNITIHHPNQDEKKFYVFTSRKLGRIVYGLSYSNNYSQEDIINLIKSININYHDLKLEVITAKKYYYFTSFIYCIFSDDEVENIQNVSIKDFIKNEKQKTNFAKNLFTSIYSYSIDEDLSDTLIDEKIEIQRDKEEFCKLLKELGFSTNFIKKLFQNFRYRLRCKL